MTNINGHDPNAAAGAADGNGSARPAYGAMQSDYPGWNPYLYGAPDASQSGSAANAAANNAAAGPNAQGAYGANPSGSGTNGYGPNGYGANGYGANGYGSNGYGRGGNPNAGNRQGMGDGSRANGTDQDDGNIMWTPYGPLNLDDPKQNPWYGKWDSLAIVAFISTFFIPFVGLVLGCFSMHRTRVFHMKGRGLAIASIVISVALIILEFYLVRSGIYGQFLETISGASGGASGGTGSAPAPSGSTSGSASSSASSGVYSA